MVIVFKLIVQFVTRPSELYNPYTGDTNLLGATRCKKPLLLMHFVLTALCRTP